MNIRTLALLSALVVLAVGSLPAQSTFMPPDELRPGMVGVGRTVFQGSQIEEFKVHILGVIANVIGPKRNLILARLEGGPLAQTGVIAGMSGSPVYVDNRLIGAVSYSLGSFSKEPIAGITPIGEMTETDPTPIRRARAGGQVVLDLPLSRESLTQAMQRAFSWARPFADRDGDVQMFGLDASALPAGSHLGTMLRPIATPLAIGGLEPDVRDTLGAAFQGLGFLPMAAGAGRSLAPGDDAPAGPLRPGDAVGVSLVDGDLQVGGTGTVTYVDGHRVYAFGHPFFNLGTTDFPMTRAYIHTLLPSLFSSMKLASTGAVIGTIQQDRATAISGTLGPGPALVPIKLSLATERGLNRSFEFRIVNDQLFTPLFTYVSILNTLTGYERQSGQATFTVKGTATFKKHGTIAFEDLFTGDQPSAGAAAYVTAPLTFLLGNDVEPIEFEGLDLTITSTEEPRTAKLERVWLDDVRPRAGKTVPLKILLRTYRGEEVTRTVPIDIPATASGSLSIFVSDGSRLAQWEQREVRQSLQARDIPQIIRAFNRARKNNRLYVKLLNADAGAVVNGETLTSLPPSVLAVLEADRNSGSFTPIRNATVGDWELPTDYAVIGSRMLTVTIDRD